MNVDISRGCDELNRVAYPAKKHPGSWKRASASLSVPAYLLHEIPPYQWRHELLTWYVCAEEYIIIIPWMTVAYSLPPCNTAADAHIAQVRS